MAWSLTVHNLKLWGTIGGMTDETGENIEDKKASAGPFLLAVAIVALIMGGIVFASCTSPAEENLSESDRVSRTASDYVNAVNNKDGATISRLTCVNFDESAGPLAGVDGAVKLEGVGNVEMSSYGAQADVRISGGGRGERDSTWTFSLDGDRLLVCN